jgi:hypothetical protein
MINSGKEWSWMDEENLNMSKTNKHYKSDLKKETIRKAKLDAFKQVLDFSKSMGLYEVAKANELETYLKDKIIENL